MFVTDNIFCLVTALIFQILILRKYLFWQHKILSRHVQSTKLIATHISSYLKPSFWQLHEYKSRIHFVFDYSTTSLTGPLEDGGKRK